MSRQPRTPSIGQLLDNFTLIHELGTSDMEPDQIDLARRSLAYRALIRSSVDNPDFYDLHNIAQIWDRCGSPEGKSPREWLADPESPRSGEDEVIEDRGDSGYWVDWDSATWYAHWIDPDTFTINEVVAMLY